jgi:hypothetical protein
MRITNVQKKQLSEIFVKLGLNILDFETFGQYKEFKVKFRHDYFAYSINGDRPDVYTSLILSVSNTKPVSTTLPWIETVKLFENWAVEIATELNTPTGWESFQSFNYLNADFRELNEKFNYQESEEVKKSIKELIDKIKTLELPQPSLLTIEQKLNELSNKVDELNKFDWKALFVGTAASLIMTLGIPPEAAGLLWEYIKVAFGGLRLKG